MTDRVPLALVTGAAQRLGNCFAQALARKGYGIILHYNTAATDKIEAAARGIEALGRPVHPVEADLTSDIGLAMLISKIDSLTDATAPLSVLVNSASQMAHADARTLSLAEFDHTFALNLRAPFFLAQQVYQRMPEGGLIVNITDVGAQKVWSGFPAYVVSKAALESLTKILARSFAPKVRVNAIAPGLVLPAAEMPAAEWDRLIKRVPLQRSAETTEVSQVLEYLLENKYVTGQVLSIDGGYSLL